MKRLMLLAALGLLAMGTAQAQAPAAAAGPNKIALAVVVPEESDVLDAAQLTRLEGKITQLVTQSGLSASGYGTNFVVYPVLSVVESAVVEGGMQNITVTTADLTLYVKQVENNLVFATLSKRLKGSGSSKAQSLGNAISQIQVADADYQKFIAQGKQKILTYYKTECGRLIQKAEASARMNKYDEALAGLLSIPEEVGECFATAQGKAVGIYKAYANQHCAELVMQARAQLALNKYEEGLTLLASVDPASKCFAEAKALANKTESEVDAGRRALFNANLSLEKQRINAVRDIARAYYSNRPSVQYNILVR